MKTEATKEDWYLVNNIDVIDSPALLVYPERIKENINRAIGMAGGPHRLRPHVKTHKAKEPALLMMERGIGKFKCATIAEAEMLALCGAKDVLLAYQPVGPKVRRFLQLVGQYPQTLFSCLIDNFSSAAALSGAAAALRLQVPVYIDLNVGMNRTGINPEKAMPLYIDVASLEGIRVAGLHAYDGHIHDVGLEERKQKCDESFKPVEQLRDEVVATGFAKPDIVAGGSLTFPIHAQRGDITCSPGTFVYWDRNYERFFRDGPFEVAALLLTRVVSLPDAIKICLDVGYKAVASESDIEHRIFFLNAPRLKIISHSEEHLVVEAEPGHGYRPGDVLYAVPFHICPTAALYEKAFAIEKGKCTGTWKTAGRNRTINY